MKRLTVLFCVALALIALFVPASRAFAAADSDSTGQQVLVMLHLPAPHFRPDANYAGGYINNAGHNARRRVAEQLAREHGLRLLNDWPMPVLGVDCYVMEVPAGTSSERVADLLSRDSRVEWAQPMRLFRAMGSEDPLYAAQPAAKYWRIDELHRVATGRDVRVAVVDSGVEDRHPDLAGQIAVKENFIDGNPYAPEIHGTAVAGIIAAHAGNGIGIAGIAPGVRLMALRACWQERDQSTLCSSFTLAKALNFAIAQGAQVINLSLSGPPDRLVQRLLEAATRRGIVVVGASDPRAPDGGFPASCPGVLAVAEQEADGAGVLRAPGRDIPTTAPGARWHFVSGSSYATAHVSGVLALLRELAPAWKPIKAGADVTGLSSAVATSGRAGTIDACAAVARAAGTCVCSCSSGNATSSPTR